MMRNNYDLQMHAAAKAFLSYDAEKLAAVFSLKKDDTALYLPILRTPHRVLLQNGSVERKKDGCWLPAGFDTALTVYDLLTNPNGYPVLAHEWCAHTSFHAVQGGTLQSSLMIHPEQSARAFDGLPAVRRACAACGGQEVAGGDFSSVLPVFTCLPVLLRYWKADEEFPAQLQFLWDRNTCRYIRYETTYYLTAAILERLKESASQ